MYRACTLKKHVRLWHRVNFACVCVYVLRREQWSLFTSYSCWQQLVLQTKNLSKDHGALGELYSTHLVSRLSQVAEDVQRIYKRVSVTRVPSILYCRRIAETCSRRCRSRLFLLRCARLIVSLFVAVVFSAGRSVTRSTRRYCEYFTSCIPPWKPISRIRPKPNRRRQSWKWRKIKDWKLSNQFLKRNSKSPKKSDSSGKKSKK